MASPPPPPPPQPPPPPPLFQSQLKDPQNHGDSKEKGCTGILETKILEEGEFLVQIKDLVKASPPTTTLDVGEDGVTLVVALPLRRVVLQNGPMCGLVALAEALELIHKTEEPVCPTKLLAAAKAAGLTKQGEMFSVVGMKSLAEMFGACHHSEVLYLGDEDNTENELKNFHRVLHNMLMGLPILFPYDADYNHSPVLRKGHAAHWALVHGIGCHLSKHEAKVFQKQSQYFEILHSNSELVILQPNQLTCGKPLGGKETLIIQELVKLFQYETSFVIAHQGKSFRTALWSFSDLIKSNKNLKEVAPKINHNLHNFICEDIIDGLCSKILLLKYCKF